jgi:hypothetical protein
MEQNITAMNVLELAVQQYRSLVDLYQKLEDHYRNIATRLALHQQVHGPLVLDVPKGSTQQDGPVNVRVVLEDGKPVLYATIDAAVAQPVDGLEGADGPVGDNGADGPVGDDGAVEELSHCGNSGPAGDLGDAGPAGEEVVRYFEHRGEKYRKINGEIQVFDPLFGCYIDVNDELAQELMEELP